MKVVLPTTVFGLWLLSGCAQLESSQVEVKNDTGVALTKVEVVAGGKRIDLGGIDSGHTVKAMFEPESDSSVDVSYHEGPGSHAFECTGDVYVTSGVRQNIAVVISPNQSCKIASGPSDRVGASLPACENLAATAYIASTTDITRSPRSTAEGICATGGANSSRAQLESRSPLELHHAHQMPGSAIHEVKPFHSSTPGVRPNKHNQGVTLEMRSDDVKLHWQMRGQEMGNLPPGGQPCAISNDLMQSLH